MLRWHRCRGDPNITWLPFAAFVVVAYVVRRYRPVDALVPHLPDWWRSRLPTVEAAVHVLGIVALVGGWLWVVRHWEPYGDWPAYYDAARSLDFSYDMPINTFGAYLYSPAFAHLFWAPALVTTAPIFFGVYAAINVGALYYLGGPVFGALALAFEIVRGELTHGNIHLLIAASAALGLRYPAAWSFNLLTKVSPAVGLLWFVARREWRQLAVATVATGAIVLVSAVFDPAGWLAWFESLIGNSSVRARSAILPWPTELRWALAVVLALGAGVLGRAWLIPIATVFAMPIMWTASLTILLAMLPLAVRERRAVAAPAVDASD